MTYRICRANKVLEQKMDCDWVFVNKNNTPAKATINEEALPNIGDGKMHDGVGYEVVFTGSKLTSRPNPVVVAVETPKA